MWRKFSTTFLGDKSVHVLRRWNIYAPGQKYFSRLCKGKLAKKKTCVEILQFGVQFYILTHTRYEHQDIALNCGTMLRECARYEALAKILLYSEDFYNFFKFVEVSTFDIASDAFSTFKARFKLIDLYNYIRIWLCAEIRNNCHCYSITQELLTKHKILCAEFLEANYDKVFAHYQGLLNSENYVTRRQSLKLLGELLLDRHNFTVRNEFHCLLMGVRDSIRCLVSVDIYRL